MADRFSHLRGLPTPTDAVTAWVEVSPEAIHFLDAVFGSRAGEANVRREYRDDSGRTLFRLYVAPGAEDEVLYIMRRISRYVRLGEVCIER